MANLGIKKQTHGSCFLFVLKRLTESLDLSKMWYDSEQALYAQKPSNTTDLNQNGRRVAQITKFGE